jgi:lantibiotic modifying enzyme
MHHALRWCEEDAEPRAIGLFDGVIGVALVASRLAVTLDAPELADRAREVLDEVATAEPASADLTSGSAGAVVGLLAARAVLDETLVRSVVTRLGEHLLDTAQESDEGTSWTWQGQPTFRNPTGYSHGTAGIALALDELYEFGGDQRHRRCAESARTYERHAFAPDVGNWADYRLAPGERRRRVWTPRYATAWCHGAPGIAVARVRAQELSDDPGSREEALVALDTTRTWLRGALSVSSPDFSLCHGIAGNLQIVERCERALGAPGGDGLAPVIDHGVRRFRAQPGAGDEPPGLMNGLAGIGAFFVGRAGLTAPAPLFITGAGIGA